MSLKSIILNAVAGSKAPAAPTPQPPASVKTVEGGGAALSIGRFSPGDPNPPTPIPVTVELAAPADAMPTRVNAKTFDGQFCHMLRARQVEGIWFCDIHVNVSPEVWREVLGRDGVMPSKKEVATLMTLHDRSAELDARIAENAAMMVGKRALQMVEEVKAQLRSGGALSAMPQGPHQIAQSMEQTRRACRAVQLEIATESFSVMKPICDRVSAAAKSMAMEMFDQEQSEAKRWGYAWRPSQQMLALLYVHFGAAHTPIRNAALGVLQHLKPDRVMFGTCEFWPESPAEKAAREARIASQSRREDHAAERDQHSARVSEETANRTEAEKAKTLADKDALIKEHLAAAPKKSPSGVERLQETLDRLSGQA